MSSLEATLYFFEIVTFFSLNPSAFSSALIKAKQPFLVLMLTSCDYNVENILLVDKNENVKNFIGVWNDYDWCYNKLLDTDVSFSIKY